ncbi:MAG: shikimate dehydrogenase, partial [Bacteroidota bacterium]
MPLLGLTGYPLSHSFSPAYFAEKFRLLNLHNWSYQLFPLEDISGIQSLISEQPDLIALNVTIPHKQAILPYCGWLSEEVKAIGAANLVLIDRLSGAPMLKAYNTDHYGFEKSLETWYGKHSGRALVMGTGGASKAIQYSLQKQGRAFDLVGRSTTLQYSDLDLSAYELIINCTPAGMKNGSAESLLPLPYEKVHAG